MRPHSTGDRSLALFLLGLAAFTPPLLMVFNVELLWFGIPALYLYVFLAWAGLIVLMGISAARGGAHPRRTAPPAPLSDSGNRE